MMRLFHVASAVALLLALTLLLVSAQLRVSQLAVACVPPTACAAEAPPALSKLHRAVAGTLGLLILLLNGLALRIGATGRTRTVCIALLALTVFLAGLGIAAGRSLAPGVVVGNVGGGVAVAALLWWLLGSAKRGGTSLLGRWSITATALLTAEIGLGAWLTVDSSMPLLVATHRFGGWLLAAGLLVVGVRAVTGGARGVGIAVTALAGATVVTAAWALLPIPHQMSSTLLLLAVISLGSRPSPAPR